MLAYHLYHEFNIEEVVRLYLVFVVRVAKWERPFLFDKWRLDAHIQGNS
jgi:hypothetical protein